MIPSRTGTTTGLPRRLAALSILILAVAMATAAAVRAQEATPIVPTGTGATTIPCGERLGIGDATVACLAIVHAALDAGPVDISVNGTVLLTGVAAATSTGFIALPADTYDLSVTASGQPGTVLLDLPDQTLGAGAGTEVAVVGSRDSSTLTALVLSIDPIAPADGTSSLRVVQAIPDAPPLDIGLETGETLIAGLPPLTATGYVTAPATATSIVVRPAGAPDVLFPLPGFTPPSAGTLTIYALGTVTNPTGISLLTVVVPGSTTDVPGTPDASTPAR